MLPFSMEGQEVGVVCVDDEEDTGGMLRMVRVLGKIMKILMIMMMMMNNLPPSSSFPSKSSPCRGTRSP